MEAKVVLHVGPGKCGSSTIQNFFSTNESPCVESIRFKLLDPRTIAKLNKQDPGKILLDEVKEELLIELRNCDCLILSHEFLFQCPCAIYNYCCLAKELAGKLVVIGYCRRQSSFLRSAYSQWLFRSTKRIKEVNEIVSSLNLDPGVFTGLERQFIASIENDFHSARQLSEYNIIDWHASYNNIAQLTESLGVDIRCGVLANSSDSSLSLVQDFCGKANLTLRPGIADDRAHKLVNKSYDHDVVEAINTAISLGFNLMGPHESNQIMSLLSTLVRAPVASSDDFLSRLARYTDCFFWPSNQLFSKQYGLDSMYFKSVPETSKIAMLASIDYENHKRTKNRTLVAERYQMLTAKMIELCINLAQKNNKLPADKDC